VESSDLFCVKQQNVIVKFGFIFGFHFAFWCVCKVKQWCFVVFLVECVGLLVVAGGCYFFEHLGRITDFYTPIRIFLLY
jgi:hypothetical protein